MAVGIKNRFYLYLRLLLLPVPEEDLVVGGDHEELVYGVEGEAGDYALRGPEAGAAACQVPDAHLARQTPAGKYVLVN